MAIPAPAAIAVSLAAGYLLGSIPFGLVATRLAGAGDIRQIGSGNIGATNVLRTGRRDLALITLVGDAGKGAAAVILAAWLFSPLAAVAAGAPPSSDTSFQSGFASRAARASPPSSGFSWRSPGRLSWRRARSG